ncbi:serine/threonine protein kinase [Pendulispora brunnea]|uniref:Serine/threonine protein kinase n=1 Tax=Pendulispora brunnea TaxID=2905690 RepID=A0ABZ2JWN7_9BACT
MSSVWLPTVAGKYRLIFELGRGGMADLMLAVVQGPGGFNKLQVLKLLRPELAAEAEFCTMFLDEARLSARINHPNVAQTNEVGFDGERYFIAMEYLEGQSLDELTRRARAKHGNVPLSVTLRALADACAGLHFAHELKDFDGTPLNVIHRDVSPQNIFVTYDGITKLLDFGIAKAADSNIRTQVGTIKGKIAYMAPEQLLAVAPIDRRADIFAVGAILWRTITGKRMWAGANEMEILQSLANHKIPEPVALPGIPQALLVVCKKAIEPNPDDRYQTALELKEAIESVLASQQGGAYSDVSRFISELFVERRKEIALAIEARLSAPETSHVSGVPVLAPQSVSRIGSMVGTSATLSRTPERDSGAPDSIRVEVSGITPERKGRRWGVAATLALAVIGGGAAFVLRPNAVSTVPTTAARSMESAPPAAAVPPPTATNSAPAAKVETELLLDVAPSHAEVLIDDVRVFGKPARGVFPRDGQLHTIVAKADGYVPNVQQVAFDTSNIHLEISLEKERRPVAPPPAPAARPPVGKARPPAPSAPRPSGAPANGPAAPAASNSPEAPAPSSKPRGRVDPLDPGDPWEK